MKKKNRVLYQYFFSYFLIFIIPFSIISIIWYQTSIQSIEKQIQLSTQNYLLQAQTTMSDHLKQLEFISKQLSLDSKVSINMATHPYYSIEARSELARYKISSNLIDELFVYYYDEPNKVSSAFGQLDLALLTQEKYTKYDFDLDQLKKDLKVKTPIFRSVPSVIGKNGEEIQGLLEYIIPLWGSDGIPYGAAMYTIKMSNVQKIMNPILEDKIGNVFMVGDDQQLLASANSNYLVSLANSKKTIEKIKETKQVKLDQEKFEVMVLKDDNFGLSYMALTNSDRAYTAIKQVHNVILTSVIVLFAMGIGFIIFISKLQYKPIKNLEKMLKNQVESLGESESYDDFARIQQHVSYFLKQNKQLTQDIYRQVPHAREQVLRKLLTGRLKHQEEINVLLKSVDVHLDAPNYFTILVSTKMLDREASIQNQTFLMTFLDSFEGLGGSYRAYGSELLASQSIALLVSVKLDDKQNPQDKIQQVVNDILLLIQTENVISPPVGVGSLVTDLSYINRSYIEGLAALDYQTLYPEMKKVYYYSEIKQNLAQNSQFFYPTDEELKLTQSLNQGDEEVALKTLAEMIKKGNLEHKTVASRRLFGNYLVNIILKSGVDSCKDDFMIDANELLDFSSLDELFNCLQKNIHVICEYVQNKLKNQESQLKVAIFDFIETEYASHELSLEGLAEEFGVSISYLSRFIKKESGVTFSKYVQQLRLEQIKNNLIDTDQTIKEIIQAAGYYDVPNYTRKFKEIVGVTPGQYRRLKR
ncbi:helix-turn-helix domain-containing protein [Carnobacterium gallinarum]